MTRLRLSGRGPKSYDPNGILGYPFTASGSRVWRRETSSSPVTKADRPVVGSEFGCGDEDRRKVTRTVPGLFSNWPRIHTGPS